MRTSHQNQPFDPVLASQAFNVIAADQRSQAVSDQFYRRSCIQFFDELRQLPRRLANILAPIVCELEKILPALVPQVLYQIISQAAVLLQFDQVGNDNHLLQDTACHDPRVARVFVQVRLIEDQLRQLMRSEGWTLLLVGIDYLSPFNDTYGFVASGEVLRFAALLLNDVVDDSGTLNDFVGHASSDTFVIITMEKNVAGMVEQLRKRFNEEVLTHYNFIDREQGGIRLSDGSLAPLMSLSIGVVSSKTTFSDIREITEAAAELRRLDQEEQSRHRANSR